MSLWVLFGAGLLSVIGGGVALANPFAASLTAELMAGYMFLAIGILVLVSVFHDQGWGARLWALLFGLVISLFGFNLVANPLEGDLRLTLVVATLLMIIGILRIPDASRVRDSGIPDLSRCGFHRIVGDDLLQFSLVQHGGSRSLACGRADLEWCFADRHGSDASRSPARVNSRGPVLQRDVYREISSAAAGSGTAK